MGGSTSPTRASRVLHDAKVCPVHHHSVIESVLYTTQNGGGKEREGQHWDESPTNPSETPGKRHGVDSVGEKRDPLKHTGKDLSAAERRAWETVDL